MTEPKFDLTKQLEHEYREITKTEFWRQFVSRIQKRYGLELDVLKSADISRIPKQQGKLWAFEYVLKSPDKIIAGEKEE